jgi:hypothetical protein
MYGIGPSTRWVALARAQKPAPSQKKQKEPLENRYGNLCFRDWYLVISTISFDTDQEQDC